MAWSIRDIDAGIAWVTLATQEQFVPQMANMELIGAVSFQKGLLPRAGNRGAYPISR
jgi:folate-binding protein YgfZ